MVSFSQMLFIPFITDPALCHIERSEISWDPSLRSGWQHKEGSDGITLSSCHSREGGNLVVLDTSLRWYDGDGLVWRGWAEFSSFSRRRESSCSGYQPQPSLGWRSFAGMTGIGWYDRVTEKESSAGMTGWQDDRMTGWQDDRMTGCGGLCHIEHSEISWDPSLRLACPGKRFGYRMAYLSIKPITCDLLYT